MTPQERQLIDDLFDRLSRLENSPRDPDAQGAIAQGLRRRRTRSMRWCRPRWCRTKRSGAPMSASRNSRAARPSSASPAGSSIRCAMRSSDRTSGKVSRTGSVPNVRAPGMGDRPVWNSGQVMQQAQGPGSSMAQPAGYGQPYGAQQPPPVPGGGGGGSFLGTAAAAAAGVVGGSLLLGSIRSMMGGGHQQSFGDTAGHSGGIEDRRPFGDRDLPGGDLAKQAGINDIGSSGGRGGDNYGSRQGLFDQPSNEATMTTDDIDHDSDGFDDDGGDGDSDYA